MTSTQAIMKISNSFKGASSSDIKKDGQSDFVASITFLSAHAGL